MEKTLYQPEYRILLDLLRAVRKEAGVNQEVLATRTGFTQSQVSKVERGERRLDIVELRRWCQEFGVSLPEFIERFEGALRQKMASKKTKVR
jgi:transcriptional regulator with XRE-family HTH domain